MRHAVSAYKTVDVIFSVLFGLFASTALADTVTVDANYLFMPKGFDDNDRVEVVVDGYFPNTCFRAAEPKVLVDVQNREIIVEAQARMLDKGCRPVLVPFTEVANLGVLPKGTYTVKSPQLPDQILNVNQANNAGPDDFLYAPVDNVAVKVDPSRQKIELEIRGRFTNTCMTWKKIEVTDSTDTLEVQPIIEIAQRPDCVNEEFAYKVMVVELPWRRIGRYLAHVRSLDGKSVNNAFSVLGE